MSELETIQKNLGSRFSGKRKKALDEYISMIKQEPELLLKGNKLLEEAISHLDPELSVLVLDALSVGFFDEKADSGRRHLPKDFQSPLESKLTQELLQGFIEIIFKALELPSLEDPSLDLFLAILDHFLFEISPDLTDRVWKWLRGALNEKNIDSNLFITRAEIIMDLLGKFGSSATDDDKKLLITLLESGEITDTGCKAIVQTLCVDPSAAILDSLTTFLTQKREIDDDLRFEILRELSQQPTDLIVNMIIEQAETYFETETWIFGEKIASVGSSDQNVFFKAHAQQGELSEPHQISQDELLDPSLRPDLIFYLNFLVDAKNESVLLLLERTMHLLYKERDKSERTRPGHEIPNIIQGIRTTSELLAQLSSDDSISLLIDSADRHRDHASQKVFEEGIGQIEHPHAQTILRVYEIVGKPKITPLLSEDDIEGITKVYAATKSNLLAPLLIKALCQDSQTAQTESELLNLAFENLKIKDSPVEQIAEWANLIAKKIVATSAISLNEMKILLEQLKGTDIPDVAILKAIEKITGLFNEIQMPETAWETILTTLEANYVVIFRIIEQQLPRLKADTAKQLASQIASSLISRRPVAETPAPDPHRVTAFVKILTILPTTPELLPDIMNIALDLEEPTEIFSLIAKAFQEHQISRAISSFYDRFSQMYESAHEIPPNFHAALLSIGAQDQLLLEKLVEPAKNVFSRTREGQFILGAYAIWPKSPYAELYDAIMVSPVNPQGFIATAQQWIKTYGFPVDHLRPVRLERADEDLQELNPAELEFFKMFCYSFRKTPIKWLADHTGWLDALLVLIKQGVKLSNDFITAFLNSAQLNQAYFQNKLPEILLLGGSPLKAWLLDTLNGLEATDRHNLLSMFGQSLDEIQDHDLRKVNEFLSSLPKEVKIAFFGIVSKTLNETEAERLKPKLSIMAHFSGEISFQEDSLEIATQLKRTNSENRDFILQILQRLSLQPDEGIAAELAEVSSDESADIRLRAVNMIIPMIRNSESPDPFINVLKQFEDDPEGQIQQRIRAYLPMDENQLIQQIQAGTLSRVILNQMIQFNPNLVASVVPKILEVLIEAPSKEKHKFLGSLSLIAHNATDQLLKIPEIVTKLQSVREDTPLNDQPMIDTILTILKPK